MTAVRLKYIHGFRDRHGKPHYYFRYRGKRWPIPAPGAEGFATAYDALLARIKANPLLVGSNVEFMPGSLAWAIGRFLASPLYSERAETTRRNYRRVLDQLREGWGAGLLRDLQPRRQRPLQEVGIFRGRGRDHRGVVQALSALHIAGQRLGPAGRGRGVGPRLQLL